MAAPYFSCRFRSRAARPGRPRTAIQAVRAADLVVASGGGYVTDTWWWHAAGVLSLLRLAQRLGKPTAMFGQGVGPISGRRGGSRALRMQAQAVLCRAGRSRLAGRPDRQGPGDILGISSSAIAVTGDDALELIPEGSAVEGSAADGITRGGSVHCGRALGLSMRVSPYAGLTRRRRNGRRPGGAGGGSLPGPIVTLPVSRYPVDGDLDALRALLHPERSGADIVLHDLATPEALITAAAGCRVIVTGSYHAAVFGLARGVPAVCLTRSSYYDAKFPGLGRCSPAPASSSLTSRTWPPGWAVRSTGVAPARQARDDARKAAAGQRQAGREAYGAVPRREWRGTR
jgi:colanic acid/amylovoran biosynthesis protein